MSGIYFSRSLNFMSANSKKASVYDRGNPASLEEEDQSFKTEFEESEEKKVKLKVRSLRKKTKIKKARFQNGLKRKSQKRKKAEKY